jgi:hypothetical protein
MFHHNTLRLVFIILAFSININSIVAQNVHHYNLWTRATLELPLTEKFQFNTELQHRTQSNSYTTNMPFNENLLNSIRLWGIYKLNEDVQFSISPFAYYKHNAIIKQPADISKPARTEVRYSMAVDLQHQLVKKLFIIDRTCIEYRDFIGDKNIIRLRNRLGFKYKLSAKASILLMDEMFFNVRGVSVNHIFDHDRLGLLFSYTPIKNFRIETGYLHITRLPITASETLEEENFIMHLYYKLQLSKKNNSNIK